MLTIIQTEMRAPRAWRILNMYQRTDFPFIYHDVPGSGCDLNEI